MTKHECENLILTKLQEISEIAKEHNSKASYLELCIDIDDNYASFNNAYFNKELSDSKLVIRYNGKLDCYDNISK